MTMTTEQWLNSVRVVQRRKRELTGVGGICIVQVCSDEARDDALADAAANGADISDMVIVLGTRLTRVQFEHRRTLSQWWAQ